MTFILRVPVKIHHQTMPDDGLNVWHLHSEEGDDFPSPADMSEALTALGEFYVTCLDVLAQGAVYSFDGEVTTESDPPQAFDIGNSFTAGNAGSSQTLPPANCIVAGWGTGLATRRGRGRTFLGPIQATANEANGTPAAAALTTIRGAQDDLLEYNVDHPGYEWGLWSKTAGTFRPFVSRTVHDKFAVLRSRRD